jgi:hypothetical protein
LKGSDVSRFDNALIGHWPLGRDGEDRSGRGHRSIASAVEFGQPGPDGKPDTAARFDGARSRIEIADHPDFHLGGRDFTLSAWVNTDDDAAEIVGDIASKFDLNERRGFHLSVVTNTGVVSTSQANYRHLHFGVDAARIDPEWTDCGRPGNAKFIIALATFNGKLYAGAFESGADETGHLWRYEGGQEWTDLGNPLGCNSISSVAEFDGALYCGTGRYKPHGSAMGPTLNTVPGGRVYRIDEDGGWIDCGLPGEDGATPEEVEVEGYATGKADETMALATYRGALYCISFHRNGVYRYDGDTAWTQVGMENDRIMALTVYRDNLYALLNGGPMMRYDGGTTWVDCGCPTGSLQTYSSVISDGELYVGTWPEGEVWRYDGDTAWTNMGRVGFEREVMGMAQYNGKVYLGSLPMANVWRMDENRYTFLGTLDETPAPLRRAWSMAVHQGRLFVGTLPGGHVKSISAGSLVTWDYAFPKGWHHVAAVREHGVLKTYVDGERVAESAAHEINIDNDRPLLIGAGPYERLRGLLSDVRLYNIAATAEEIRAFAGADE